MIPEGWHEKKIEEICLRITDGKHGDCENQVGSGYFFISAKDILENRIDYENSRQITERDFLETHKRTKFEAGDIALTNTGSIGKVVVALEGEFTSRTTFQKSVAVLKIDKKVGHANFLLNFLKLNQSHLNTIATGSSQKNLLLSALSG